MYYLRFFIIVCEIVRTFTALECCNLGTEAVLDSSKVRFEEKTPIAVLDNEKFTASEELPTTEEYDFIIVGGGTTGSVIANRLSEIHNWKVLLLEAGEKATVLTDVPPLAPMFQFTKYNWGYLTEKEKNASLGLLGGRMHWPRGKGLGGSSLINYMIHVRGSKEDYDKWEAFGNPGWSYRDLLPLFLKLEDSKIRFADPGYHGTGGPLSVEDVSYRSKLSYTFIAAAKELGYKHVDYNGKNQLGVSHVHATTRRGSRCSAEKAFLQTARSRPNLIISTKSRVTRIMINPKSKKTYGVEYIKNKRYYRVRTKKEVILSAGVFNSPQLLMLSGIGPEKHLQNLNIMVLQNLPVGQKLYDHLTFLGLVFTVNDSVVIHQRELEDPVNILQYLYNGTGPLSILGGVEALLFLNTNVKDYKNKYPNIEFLFTAGGLHTDNGVVYRKAMRITDKIYNTVWRPLEHLYAFSIWPVLLHPKSCGYLQLKSKNPFHWPKFYGNYFSDAKNEDIKTFLSGIREIQRIVATRPFQQYGIQQVRTPIPGCERCIYDSDDYWECALRHVSVTLYHQTSTCKMGPPNDIEAVVDNRLRVYGIQSLRVADTSIFPTTVSAHTAIPAYVVGEKAAEIIKKDWSIK